MISPRALQSVLNFLRLSVLLCAAAACLPMMGQAQTNTPATNAPAGETTKDESPKEIKDVELGLTVGIPKGWLIQPFPHSRFPMAFGPQVDGVTPNINLETEIFDGDLGKYVTGNEAVLIKEIKELKVLNRDDFETTSGLKGIKLSTESKMDKLALRQNFYFFQSSPKNFIVLTATSPASAISKMEPLFDEAIKTLVVSKK
ncbi:MAG: hypothetical protein ACAI35_06350 [Candidatus Methylacidiphilales bacterium]|nr:hypothetical protein [Candidatus Methylacidiphilales bacterium]